jgi:hypothetical protein
VIKRQRGNRQEEQAIVGGCKLRMHDEQADRQAILAIATAIEIYLPAGCTNNGHCARGFHLSQASESLFLSRDVACLARRTKKMVDKWDIRRGMAEL